MRLKMAIFKEGNSVCRDAKMYCRLMKNRGDDATENVNFQRRKQRLQGPKNFKLNFDEFSMKDRGTMRQKMSIFKERNNVCRVQNLKLNFDDLKHLTI